MSFDQEKQAVLSREDRSLKGTIDVRIMPLCDIINQKQDYYTTSSCAGRIVLIKIPDSGKKNEAKWLFVSHEPVGLYNIKSKLENLPEEQVWFRFQPLILHICCRDVAHAGILLDAVRDAGLKRSGIISLGKRIMIEVIGTDHFGSIITKDSRLLVDDCYLAELVCIANTKLAKNFGNIDRLAEAIKCL